MAYDPPKPQPIIGEGITPAGIAPQDPDYIATGILSKVPKDLPGRAQIVAELLHQGVLVDQDFADASTAAKGDLNTSTDALLHLGTARLVEQDTLNKAPWYKQAGARFLANLAETTGGALAQAGQVTTLGIPTLGSTLDVAAMQDATGRMKNTIESRYVGAPDRSLDPIGYAMWEQKYPGTASAAADIADFGLWMLATKGLSVEGAIGKLGSRFVSGPLKSLVLPGVGFGAGYFGASLAGDEHPVRWGMAGAGFLALGGSLLVQRPIGVAAKFSALQDLQAKLGDAGLGKLLATFPRLTVGKLAEAGLKGAAFDVLNATGSGASPEEALAAGVQSAGDWMLYDLALSRIGATARWATWGMAYRQGAAEKLATLSWFKTPATAQSAAGALNVATNMLPGALVGGLMGGIPGAVAGAVGGGALLTGAQGMQMRRAAQFLGALKATVPETTLAKVINGAWSTLAPDEVKTITQGIVDYTAREAAAAAAEDAQRILIESVLGTGGTDINKALTQVKSDLRLVMKALYEAEQSGLPPTSPQIVQLGRRAMELNETLEKMLKGESNPYVSYEVNRILGAPEKSAAESAQTFLASSPTAMESWLNMTEAGLLPAGWVMGSGERSATAFKEVFEKAQTTQFSAREAWEVFERAGMTGGPPLYEIDSPQGYSKYIERIRTFSRERDASARYFKEFSDSPSVQQITGHDALDSIIAATEDPRSALIYGTESRLVDKMSKLFGPEQPFAPRAVAPAGSRGVKRPLDLSGGSTGEKLAGAGLMVGLLGSAGYDYLTPPDEQRKGEAPVNKAALDWIIGLGLLAGLAYKGKAWRAKPGSALDSIVKIVRPALEDMLPETEARAVIGRPTEKFFIEREGKKISGRRLFQLLPPASQEAHYLERVRAISETDAKGSAADRRAHFLKANASYFPSVLTTDNIPRIEEAFMSAARKVGMTPADTTEAWRAMLSLSRMGPRERLTFRSPEDLIATLGRDTDGPFGSATNLEDLRKIATATEFLSGPEIALPENITREHRRWRQSLTPTAKEIKGVVAEIDAARSDPRLIGRGEVGMSAPFMPGLRPLNTYLNEALHMAERAKVEGNKGLADVAQSLADLTRGLARVNQNVRAEIDKEWKSTLLPILQPFRTQEQLAKLRNAIEDKTFRESLIGTDNTTVEAALGIRKFMERMATRLELPTDWKIDEYFPWIYSQRSLNELRGLLAKDQIPTDWIMPVGYGLPAYKILRNLEARLNKSPIAELIDPRETLYVYLTGAVRKVHVDQLLANFGPDYWKMLREQQPHLAASLGRHFLDTLGIPSAEFLSFLGTMDSVGRGIERHVPFFHPGELFHNFLDDYLLSGAGAKIPSVIRHVEYLTKIGGSAMSAITNLSQLVINTGAYVAFPDMFKGAMLYEKGTWAEKIPLVAPLIDPGFKGRAKLAWLREQGISSETASRAFDDLADLEMISKGKLTSTVVKGGVLGLATGAATGAMAGSSEGDTALYARGGALMGAGVGLAAPLLMRRVLRQLRNTATYFFDSVEAFNRGSTAIAAREQYVRAATGNVQGNVISKVIGGAALGAAGGAGAGLAFPGVFGDETPVQRGAIGGAILGGVLGSRGESLGKRALSDASIIANSRLVLEKDLAERWNAALKKMRPFTTEEIADEYSKMIVDLTQFRLGREGRGYALRTPLGEIFGALQSYTLNQMEYAGNLSKSFFRSLGDFRAGRATDLDLRFPRHLAFLFGLSGAYSMMTMSLAPSRDAQFWLSRIGFGVAPFIQWNESADQWQVTNPSQQVLGPFVSDMTRAANFFIALQDPHKRDTFNRDLDGLIQNLVPGLRQLRAWPKVLGKGFSMLGMEGVQELDTLQRGANAIAAPATNVKARQMLGGDFSSTAP